MDSDLRHSEQSRSLDLKTRIPIVHGLILMGFLIDFKNIDFEALEVVSKSKSPLKNHHFDRFPLYFPIEITMGKSAPPTLRRPNFAKNENFYNRKKMS